MTKKGKESKTISVELSVYTELKSMKIVDEEGFNSVIKKVLLENQRLKGAIQPTITGGGAENGHI
jgi:predicted CopG family antitoxin